MPATLLGELGPDPASPVKTTDRAHIRSLLDQDPIWSAYAIADLEDHLFGDCDWFVEGRSLALVYRGLEQIRPLFLIGSPATVLPEVSEHEVYINLRPEMRGEVERFYPTDRVHEMFRMALGEFQPAEGSAAPLSRADAPRLRELYALGGGLAFAPSQLASGYFRGIFEADALVAVAGIHVASPRLGVAAVGNIMAHPDFRGRGLAARCLSAVIAALKADGVSSIVLNVETSNDPAVRLYQRLGFNVHCRYFEGPATRIRETFTAL